jgi:hypothetical protein
MRAYFLKKKVCPFFISNQLNLYKWKFDLSVKKIKLIALIKVSRKFMATDFF